MSRSKRSSKFIFFLASILLHGLLLAPFFGHSSGPTVPEPRILPGIVSVDWPSAKVQTVPTLSQTNAETSSSPLPAPALLGARGAKLVGNLSPTYPQRSREVGESGVVLLAFDVDSAGGAANILVKESSGYPRLDQAAVESLRQSCFEPATENGKSVASHTELRISFELK